MLAGPRHLLRKLQAGTVSLGHPRSSLWPGVEHAWRFLHPSCISCGGTSYINVHHCAPFHLFPMLELADGTGKHCQIQNPDGTFASNLATLCNANDCHLYVGHGGRFDAYNPNVLADAAELLVYPDRQALIWARAKSARLGVAA